MLLWSWLLGLPLALVHFFRCQLVIVLCVAQVQSLPLVCENHPDVAFVEMGQAMRRSFVKKSNGFDA